MTLRCIAVDDEPAALRVIEKYAGRVDSLDLVNVFRSPLKALDYLHDHEVELIFLDISMRDLSGIQFLKSLAERPLVILTTAHPEYAVESYEYDVTDYLLKPIEFERFLKAVNKALSQFHRVRDVETGGGGGPDTSGPQAITLKSGADLLRIKINDILYVQSAGNYVVFVTRRSEVMTLMPLKEAATLLPADRFRQVHRCYIVGLKHITRVGRRHLSIGDHRIPLGDLYRQGFLEAMRHI